MSEIIDPKWMDLKEFYEQGFLQEANRLFFHPLGLALAVSINEGTGEVKLAGLWDYRDDPEGILFDWSARSDEDVENTGPYENAERVENERLKHLSKRFHVMAELYPDAFPNQGIEPLPKKTDV